MSFTSTRSTENEDAHRDFDGFDEDEELRRFRAAVRAKQWEDAARLAANLDEHLSRGGPLPVAWLGPACMQDASDQRGRLEDAAARAAKMSHSEREAAISGYVTP